MFNYDEEPSVSQVDGDSLLHTEYDDDELDQGENLLNDALDPEEEFKNISSFKKAGTKSRCSSSDRSEGNTSRVLTPLSEYNDEPSVKEYFGIYNKTRDALCEKAMLSNGGNRRLLSKRKLQDTAK